jgi:hypothetical protein
MKASLRGGKSGQRHRPVVSGDRHVLALGDDLPVQTPRAFLDSIETLRL